MRSGQFSPFPQGRMAGDSYPIHPGCKVTAQTLNGKAIADQVIGEVAEAIERRSAAGLPAPGLAVILVGEDPASNVYVARKEDACRRAGIRSLGQRLPAQTSQDELLQIIRQLNTDPKVNGILVQLPLPDHIDEQTVTEAIDPGKDCDGFHPYNIGRLTLRKPALRACTPKGIMRLLDATGEVYKGRHAVVVGASNIVGRPMTLELALAGATVTLCHRFTRNLQQHVAAGDMLILATGKAGAVRGDWIKPGATVIDVGIHRREDGSLYGDLLDVEQARERAAWLTPVPGGVGPMTVAMLMQNTLEATCLQESR